MLLLLRREAAATKAAGIEARLGSHAGTGAAVQARARGRRHGVARCLQLGQGSHPGALTWHGTVTGQGAQQAGGGSQVQQLLAELRLLPLRALQREAGGRRRGRRKGRLACHPLC